MLHAQLRGWHIRPAPATVRPDVPADPAQPLLFDSSFLSKLEQLLLLSRRLFRGEHRADRRGRQHGSSLEFADYRNYTRGDDLRNIDWNIYGRLDRLFIKLFEKEQDLPVYFLVDVSASMRWEPPDGTRLAKLDQARRVAASLAYIALSNLDRVNLIYFSDDLGPEMGVTRGKSQFHKVLQFLKRVPAAGPGTTRLQPSLRNFATRVKGRGLVFVLSDLFDPEGYEQALSLLRHSQFEPQVLHVIDPEELDPPLSGDLRLIETETGEVAELTANESMLRAYREEANRFVRDLEMFCLQRQIGYAQASTAVGFEDLVLRVLRQGRLLA